MSRVNARWGKRAMLSALRTLNYGGEALTSIFFSTPALPNEDGQRLPSIVNGTIPPHTDEFLDLVQDDSLHRSAGVPARWAAPALKDARAPQFIRGRTSQTGTAYRPCIVHKNRKGGEEPPLTPQEQRLKDARG